MPLDTREVMGPLLALGLAAATLNVPFVPQQKDTCAAASLAMVLHYWDQPIPADEIARHLVEPELHGILGSRLTAFAQERGFQAMAYEGDLLQLRDFLEKGRPLIVALAAGPERYHDVVVIGLDDELRDVVVNDPALGARRRIPVEEFEKRWAASGHWTLLVLPSLSKSGP
jgi:ABC-type bacteriocin/lantibiotic exporter with double-glycine peptidase domain